jgi:hypothetical protein
MYTFKMSDLKGMKWTDLPSFEEIPSFIYASITLAMAVELCKGDQQKAIEVVENTSKQILAKFETRMGLVDDTVN